MHVMKVKKGSSEWILRPNDLKKHFEYVPGSVKMAMGSVVLGVMMWTSLQFGSQFSMSTINVQAFSMFRVPVSLQPYIGWYHNPTKRMNSGLIPEGSIPDLNEKLKTSVVFATDTVARMMRFELNLEAAGMQVVEGTPMHGQLIESYPTIAALKHGKESLIATKASLYLSHSICRQYGFNSDQCARYITSHKLLTDNSDSSSEEDGGEATLSLGERCAALHGHARVCSKTAKYRSINGSCNHLTHPAWGQAETSYRRLLFPQYADGIQQPRGFSSGMPMNKMNALPSARVVSSSLAPDADVPDNFKTLALMQWTQFVEHDLAHTPVTKKYNLIESSILCCASEGWGLAPRYLHPACMPILITNDDPVYSSRNMKCMNYVRSVTAMRPDCSFGPAEQMNQASHYLDGSMIYGSTEEKAAKLRLLSNGHLKNNPTDGRMFLPSADNPSEQCQLSPDSQACFQSGDTRVNSHPHLTVMHTVWLREHNRIADKLAILNPQWDDERLFQEARRIVIAEIQHITYSEWLPLVLGSKYTTKFGLENRKEGFSTEFSENVDPSITNSFATAALRFVHSLMDGTLSMVQEDRTVNHTIQLRDHFNRPRILEESNYLDGLLRGLATQNSQQSDLHFTEDITSLLYQDVEKYGLDIISLDVQRGRDHGLPSYNQFRKICGLNTAQTFEDLGNEIPKTILQKLKSMYRHPDDIDLLIGGMAERLKDDGLLGTTFRCIIGEQFSRTRKGDRFFYDLKGQSGSFTPNQLKEIRKMTLARVFCDNSDDIVSMQRNVFQKPSERNPLISCKDNSKIAMLDLSMWREESRR